MKANSKNLITSSQMFSWLMSALLGTEILYMPRYMVMNARQDGWIYMILGAVYPAYIVFIVGILSKYYPDNNILYISKKLFGKIIGSIFNIFFMIQFIFYTVVRISQLSNLVRVYMVYFLSSKLVILITIVSAAYACYKGFQSLSRLNEMLFYLTLPIVFVAVGALFYGNILNLMPVFQDGFSAFTTKVAYGAFGYYGIEIYLLIYPFIDDKNKIKKTGYISVAVACIVYTWSVFICIYYIGIDIIPKYLWPVVTTVKATNLRAIRNFTYIFLYFWVLVVFKSISVHYYASSLILNDFIKKIKTCDFCIYLIPFIYYLSSKLGTEVENRQIMGKAMPVFTIFNITFISILALLVIVKKGKKQ